MTKEFKEWLESRVTWIASLIVATVLSLIVLEITDPILRYEFLIGILIIAIFTLVAMYSKYFYDDYHMLIISANKVAKDAILIEKARKISFFKKPRDKSSLYQSSNNEHDEIKAKRSTVRYLANKMDNAVYDRYKIEIESNSFIPDFKSIILKKNGELLSKNDLDFEAIDPTTCTTYFNDTEQKKSESIKFYVPLQLQANDKCNFEVEFETDAYQKAISGQPDYVDQRVHRFTKILKTEIVLEESLKKDYVIKPPRDGENKNEITFKVFDWCDQRMEYYETDLRMKKKTPYYHGDKAGWTIIDPKIGYSYRMYFTLMRVSS